eukprot:m.217919 g.217919  ORF g.217919 m.217919 type:complete len:180 (+) comp33246_c1_seq2:116-655(+)
MSDVDVVFAQLQSMGFSPEACQRAVHYAGADTEAATNWLVENMDNPDLNKPFSPPTAVIPNLSIPTPCKMVFVVNNELTMGVGKIAAQVGHAAVNLFKSIPSHNILKQQWEGQGAMKIVVQGTATDLLKTIDDANSNSLYNVCIHDAGKTQIAAGSMTVVGVFGSLTDVDKICRHYALL